MSNNKPTIDNPDYLSANQLSSNPDYLSANQMKAPGYNPMLNNQGNNPMMGNQGNNQMM